MKILELFGRKQVFSFEVFPPKRTAPVDTITRALDGLSALRPDFISVTYGAGGRENSGATADIAREIQDKHLIASVAHLTGLYLAREDVPPLLESFRAQGIENILALRGDRTPGLPPKGAFRYASDLVALIRAHGDFHIVGACYPEGHGESGGQDRDIRNLKVKVDAGVNHLITQLFFDNRYFYRFRDRAAAAGIRAPIQAGIMPVINKRQIERMASLCGAALPEKFTKMMAKYEHNPDAMRDAGIAYAVDQIADLLTQDADGIHLYTMNNLCVARKICEALGTLRMERREVSGKLPPDAGG